MDGKYIFGSKNVCLFLCNDYYSVYNCFDYAQSSSMGRSACDVHHVYIMYIYFPK